MRALEARGWPPARQTIAVLLLALACLVIVDAGVIGSAARAERICTPVDVEENIAQSKIPVGERASAAQCGEYLEAARISQAVYKNTNDERRAALGPGSAGTVVKDWTELNENLFPEGRAASEKLAKEAGFQAGIFETDDTVYVAFRGTDELRDWEANLKRGMGVETSQHLLACQVARQAKRRYANSGKKIVFTGHSLGGGLATRAADCVGGDAVVFNSDGATDDQVAAAKADPGAAHSIKNIYTPNDVLHMPANWTGGDFLSEMVRGRMRQRGDLIWVPHTETCSDPDRDLTWGNIGKAAGRAIAKVGVKTLLKAGVNMLVGHPVARISGTATLAETGKELLKEGGKLAIGYLGTVKDEVLYNHAMETMIQNLAQCAAADRSENAANEKSEGPRDDLTDARNIRPGGAPTTSRSTDPGPTGEDRAKPGGQMQKPPPIIYHCVFSDC